MSHPFEKQFADLYNYIERGNKINKSVSTQSTFWHLEHTVQIISDISSLLTDSNPEDFDSKFSFTKWVIMSTGYIPRGKGRAPKNTIPKGIKSREELHEMLETARRKSKDLQQLPKTKTFKHPLFGWLKRDETIKFIKIHTEHHIKIIRDIIKK